MIVVDTGVLYALADRRDAHHGGCVRWLAANRAPLLVPPPVIAEACYLIGRHLGPNAEAIFLEAFGPGQAFSLGDLLDPDLEIARSLTPSRAANSRTLIRIASRSARASSPDHRRPSPSWFLTGYWCTTQSSEHGSTPVLQRVGVPYGSR